MFVVGQNSINNSVELLEVVMKRHGLILRDGRTESTHPLHSSTHEMGGAKERERGRENERAAQPGGGCAWFWWWGLPSLKGRSSSSQCFHWFWLTASQVLLSLVWSASSPPSGRGDEFQELMPNQGGRSVSLLLPAEHVSVAQLLRDPVVVCPKGEPALLFPNCCFKL